MLSVGEDDLVEGEVGEDGGTHFGVALGFGLEEFEAFSIQALEFGAVGGSFAGLFFGEFPAFTFEAEFFGVVTGAAQVGELLGGADDGTALFDGIGRDADAVDEAADGEERGIGGAIVERDVAGIVFEVVGFLDDLRGPSAGVLVAEPILEATLAPFAEVLFGDRASAEILEQDFLDFGEGVEPGDEFGADLAIGETVV